MHGGRPVRRLASTPRSVFWIRVVDVKWVAATRVRLTNQLGKFAVRVRERRHQFVLRQVISYPSSLDNQETVLAVGHHSDAISASAISSELAEGATSISLIGGALQSVFTVTCATLRVF